VNASFFWQPANRIQATSRVLPPGADIDWTQLQWRRFAAWYFVSNWPFTSSGHDYASTITSGGKGADISGTIIGLFGVSAPGASVATDWAEVTAGIRIPAWKNGAVTASLAASVPSNVPTTYAARLGVSQTF